MIHPRYPTSLPLLGFCASVGLFPGASLAQTPSCGNWVLHTLGFTAAQAQRIDPRSEPGVDFFFRLRELETGTPPSGCTEFRTHVSQSLHHFLRTRWRTHLERRSLAPFRIETTRMLGTFSDTHLPARSAALIQELLPLYFDAIRTRLIEQLERSPWRSRAARLVSLQLEQWTPEWTEALGAPAAAAISLDQGRVALDATQASPLDLEYLLFHELAHAVSWETLPRTAERLLENERDAWRDTLAWAEWQKRQGAPEPDWLDWVRRFTRPPNGSLDALAEAVLRSRGISFHRP